MFKYSIHAFGSFKCFIPASSRFWINNWYFGSHKFLAYKQILSIRSLLSFSFIKLRNAFVFSRPEPPVVNIFYGWSGIYGHFKLIFALFSFVISSKLSIFVRYKNDISNKIYIIKMSFWDEKEANWLFQELPFYNTSIEKPYIKRRKNVDLLHELSFYDELNIKKNIKSI